MFDRLGQSEQDCDVVNMLDKFTFGDSKCSTDLADRLNQLGNPKVVRKVTSFIHGQFTVLNRLDEIPNLGTKTLVLNLYRFRYNHTEHLTQHGSTSLHIVPE